jgi:hypothetical protein
MKATLILITMLISSCGEPKYTKPYIIVYKSCDALYFDGNARYEYQDSNGNMNYFRDSCYKYNIGDTIK